MQTSKRYRVIVCVSNDLLTDQRVLRACDAMHECGLDVTLIGRSWPDGSMLKRPFRSKKIGLIFHRTAFFYAEFNLRLFCMLLFSKADLLYANDTDTLLAVGLAAKIRRTPYIYDAHELFPDVPELVDHPFVRKVWAAIEKRFIPKAAACITVNQSVAEVLQRRYGVEFGVVRNLQASPAVQGSRCVPAQGDLAVSGRRSAVSEPSVQSSKLLLYQGAVNKGRCVKELIDAMEYVTDYRLVVAGGGDLLDEMQRYAKSRQYSERIVFTGRIKPEELKSLTPNAALGFCIMEDMGLNYYLSLPNRISDYAGAGVPVVASDFPEIGRVVKKYGIGTLVDEATAKDPRRLADTIRETLREWESMPENERRNRFAAAKEDLSWSREKQIFTEIVKKTIQ